MARFKQSPRRHSGQLGSFSFNRSEVAVKPIDGNLFSVYAKRSPEAVSPAENSGLAKPGLPSSVLSATVFILLATLAGARIVPANLWPGPDGLGLFDGGSGFTDDIAALGWAIVLSWCSRGVG